MWFQFLVYTLLISNILTENKKNEFVPTEEWQKVEPGQPLPPGLHIRHDFQKKITEAKLLDPIEKNDKDNAIISIQKEDDTEKLSREKLEKVLSKMNEKEQIFTPSEEDIEAVKKKYKSYEKIKEELKELNFSIKTDSELITELLQRYEKLNTQTAIDNTDELLTILIDLEYYVHQVDNAQEFIKLGGLKLIFTMLQSTNADLQIAALRVLSAAVQHNPKVQISLYEADTIPILIDFLSNSNTSVVLSTLTVINNFLRRFPTAQMSFIQNQGFGKIRKLIDNDRYFQNSRFKSKILSLITDLFMDSKELTFIDKDYKNIHSESVANYLISNFKTDGWCDVIKMFVDQTVFHDHELIEKIFVLIHTTKHLCWDMYNNENFKTILQDIVTFYENISQTEIDENSSKENDERDLYYTNFKSVIQNITDMIYDTKATFVHSEL